MLINKFECILRGDVTCNNHCTKTLGVESMLRGGDVTIKDAAIRNVLRDEYHVKVLLIPHREEFENVDGFTGRGTKICQMYAHVNTTKYNANGHGVNLSCRGTFQRRGKLHFCHI